MARFKKGASVIATHAAQSAADPNSKKQQKLQRRAARDAEINGTSAATEPSLASVTTASKADEVVLTVLAVNPVCTVITSVNTCDPECTPEVTSVESYSSCEYQVVAFVPTAPLQLQEWAILLNIFLFLPTHLQERIIMPQPPFIPVTAQSLTTSLMSDKFSLNDILISLALDISSRQIAVFLAESQQLFTRILTTLIEDKARYPCKRLSLPYSAPIIIGKVGFLGLESKTQTKKAKSYLTRLQDQKAIIYACCSVWYLPFDIPIGSNARWRSVIKGSSLGLYVKTLVARGELGSIQMADLVICKPRVSKATPFPKVSAMNRAKKMKTPKINFTPNPPVRLPPKVVAVPVTLEAVVSTLTLQPRPQTVFAMTAEQAALILDACSSLPGNDVNKSERVEFVKTPLPAIYDPAAIPFTPASDFTAIIAAWKCIHELQQSLVRCQKLTPSREVTELIYYNRGFQAGLNEILEKTPAELESDEMLNDIKMAQEKVAELCDDEAKHTAARIALERVSIASQAQFNEAEMSAIASIVSPTVTSPTEAVPQATVSVIPTVVTFPVTTNVIIIRPKFVSQKTLVHLSAEDVSTKQVNDNKSIQKHTEIKSIYKALTDEQAAPLNTEPLITSVLRPTETIKIKSSFGKRVWKKLKRVFGGCVCRVRE